ncbi:hypothetical protein EWM64_g7833 [Hericium alpestre]|uniref:HNH nuclease domain-containing protein n=1 Tax=Hericium alpestre TaxID=135208 RepID=A0A4Y9ZQS4_9AGAM|nr:hypothetical protein EWM64_g7833 [Hericium alpestre]
MSTDSTPPNKPVSGSVWLVLTEDINHQPVFYLDIEITVIKCLCLKPVKFFRFLVWCILGAQGSVLYADSIVSDDAELVSGGIYRLRAPRSDLLERAIDMEMIRARSSSQTSCTSAQEGFYDDLVDRDVCCVFTGDRITCLATHIIPFAEDNQLLNEIVTNRQIDIDEDVSDLFDLCDVRNGLLASADIHCYLDKRILAILPTPNHILQIEDIPPRAEFRREPFDEVEYPAGKRFTLQHLVRSTGERALHGLDAKFKKQTDAKLPSTLLLNYHYGNVAVQQWGRGWERVLSQRAIGKRGCAAIAKETTDDDEGPDAGDFILYCSVNTEAARKRREDSAKQFNDSINDWRNKVPG